MTRRACLLLVLAMAAPAALAQNELKWSTAVEDGVKAAKKTQRPIMFYITSRGEDRNEKTERQHRASFRNARVAEQGRRYIPIQLSRSRYKDLLEKWQLSSITNQEIVFATPEGDMIDRASDSDIASPELFTKKMAEVFQRYRQQLFAKDVKPKLEQEDAPAKDLLDALKMIEDFLMLEADASVAQLASNEKAPANVRLRAYEVLAILSTDAATKTIFGAAPADKRVAALLTKLTPGAAESLLPFVGGDSLDAHVLAYNTIAKITKLSDAKPDTFWNGPNEQAKITEIERVKAHVEKVLKRWKEEDAPYR